MELESFRLGQCQEILEECARQGKFCHLVYHNTAMECLRDLFNLMIGAKSNDIKLEAANTAFRFILTSPHFTEEQKELFLQCLYQEGTQRLSRVLPLDTKH